jgi:Methyltransferase domain
VAAKRLIDCRLCPICYHDACEVVYRVPADGLLSECNVVMCNRCDFCFSNTPTTQATFDRHYAESKRYGDEVVGPESWNAKRYAVTAKRLKKLLPRDCNALLDVGGSSGFIDKVRKYMPGATWTNFRIADIQLHNDVRLGCVTLCHVLEHVRDLESAMARLSQVANTVYAEVPDAARYYEFCESPWQAFNSEHVNHFTAAHLRALFERHGFEQTASGRGECGDPPPHMQPYVWGFFKRAESCGDAVRAYCDRSAALWQRIEAKVKPLRGIACWGIGQLARKIEPLLDGCAAAYAVDKFAGEEPRYAGLLIDKPEHMLEVCQDIPILVTTIQHRESVLADIEQLQLKNEVITLP